MPTESRPFPHATKTELVKLGGMLASWILQLVSAHFALIVFNVSEIRGFASFPPSRDLALQNSLQLSLTSCVRDRMLSESFPRNLISIEIARPLRPRWTLATCAVPSLVEAVPFNLLLSKVLGYCIVAGSFFLQLPQLLKIMKSRSVHGLSLLSQYSEVPISSSKVTYHYLKNLPFSSYGEPWER